MDLIHTNTELAKYQDHFDLIESTFNQIHKDFEFFGIDLISPEQFQNWDGVFEITREAVTDLLNRNMRKLMQIIYRVDLSESMLGNALSGVQEVDSASQIAVMIMARELKKVLLRRSIE